MKFRSTSTTDRSTARVLIDRKIKKALDDYYAEYGVKKA